MDTTQDTQNSQIRTEWNGLMKQPVAELKAIYARSHRVCSTTGMTKTDLVTGIMYARHGARRIAAAFGLAR